MSVVQCQERVPSFWNHKEKHLRWMATKMALEQWERPARKDLQERSFKKKMSVQVLLADLKACCKTQDLEKGKRVHAAAVKHGHDSNIFVMSTLVRMYGKCGRMVDARCVFDNIQQPNAVCWNALLLGYTENRKGLVSLELFSCMKASACAPDSVTFVAALKACTSMAADEDASGKEKCLGRGRAIHSDIGSNLNHYVQNTLIDMYAKCGSISDAHRVFDSMQKPDVVSWTSLLLGYAENGEGLLSLDLFSSMKASRCAPNSVTYVAVLKACTSLAVEPDCHGKTNCLERGRKIHLEIGSNLDNYVQNMLIDMYSKCGSMVDAHNVFNSMQQPDVVSWTALLSGYEENGEGVVALDLFSRMKTRGFAPDAVTYVAALKACTSLAVYGDGTGKKNCLELGRKIHLEVGTNLDHYVQSTLIDMYAKCGSMVEARRVFENIQKPNTASWNALLLGYAEQGDGIVALDLFSRMKARGFAPDAVTHVAALKACTSLAVVGDGGEKKNCLERGRQIHLDIGSNLDQYVHSMLIDLYAKCGSMTDAQAVFNSIQKPNVVCWNALLLGYAENREGLVALDLFSSMSASACAPDSVTYIAALKACTSLAVDGDASGKKSCLERGKKIHLEIGSNLNPYVQNTLIDMYSKSGSMVEAHSVFDSMRKPDIVSWTTLIVGYAENGKALASLDMFSKMKASGCAPNSVTYVAALKACTSLAVDGGPSGMKSCLERGREIHLEIGTNLDHYVQNTLIDMYAKCGSMVESHSVFDSMQKADVVSWTALLVGYTENGEGLVALDLFSRMKASGCVPDSVTYIAALKACISLALDGDGSGRKNCLEWGRGIHSEIGSNLNHYVQTMLIDMYGRCGSMVEAHCVFDGVQRPDTVCWNTLLMRYVEDGKALAALDLFSKMEASGYARDSLTHIAALKACGFIGALSLGQKVHSEITEFSAHVVTCLVDFYGKCGSIVEAHEVFGLHPKARDITTWNALLAGYGRCGNSDRVFSLFEAMQDEGFQPDSVTFVCMLSCCSHAGVVEKAKEYFERMDVQYGVTPTVMHYSCMVDVLGRANLLNEAVVILQKMPFNPDAITWMALLGACRKWKNVEIGRMAFQALSGKDEKVASAQVLMAHICSGEGHCRC